MRDIEVKTTKEIIDDYSSMMKDLEQSGLLKSQIHRCCLGKWLSAKDVLNILKDIMDVTPNSCSKVKPIHIQAIWNIVFDVRTKIEYNKIIDKNKTDTLK